jgi:hypothetical protein
VYLAYNCAKIQVFAKDVDTLGSMVGKQKGMVLSRATRLCVAQIVGLLKPHYD